MAICDAQSSTVAGSIVLASNLQTKINHNAHFSRKQLVNAHPAQTRHSRRVLHWCVRVYACNARVFKFQKVRILNRTHRCFIVPPSTYSKTIPRFGSTEDTPRNRTMLRCDKPAFSLASAINSSTYALHWDGRNAPGRHPPLHVLLVKVCIRLETEPVPRWCGVQYKRGWVALLDPNLPSSTGCGLPGKATHTYCIMFV